MSLFGLFRKKPVYDLDKAVVVVFAKVPADTRERLDHEDIELILKLAANFLEEQQATRPEGTTLDIHHRDLCPYITQRAAHRDKSYLDDDIHAVLEAELEYMKTEGIVEED